MSYDPDNATCSTDANAEITCTALARDQLVAARLLCAAITSAVALLAVILYS